MLVYRLPAHASLKLGEIVLVVLGVRRTLSSACTLFLCTLCHQNTNGIIKPDSDKVPRKYFPRIVNSKLFMVAHSLSKTQVRLSGVPFHDTKGKLSNGGRLLERYLN